MLSPLSTPAQVRQAALDRLAAVDFVPDVDPARYERMLSALHDQEWRPLHTQVDSNWIRWCEWPDCLRSFNVLTGPDPKTDGAGWIYLRTGTHLLLCPDHANAGHRPQHFADWKPGDTTINTSCECGERGYGLAPASTTVCVEWWRHHVRQLPEQPAAEAEPDQDLVQRTARELAGFQLRLGPNTLAAIRAGQDQVLLTGGERDDVARAAVAALHGGTPPIREDFTPMIDLDAQAQRELLELAARAVIEDQFASTGTVQRRCRVGYATAERLMDQLHELGVVSPREGTRARDVLVTVDQVDEVVARIRGAA